MKLVCLAVLLMASVAHGGKMCTDVSQCQSGECCQIMSEFMVVSKRDLVTALPAIKPIKAGTCEPYKLEGSHCNSFDKMNGYCSCEPGTSCKTEEIPLPTKSIQGVPLPTRSMPAQKRRSMLPPRPGYQWISTCKKI